MEKSTKITTGGKNTDPSDADTILHELEGRAAVLDERASKVLGQGVIGLDDLEAKLDRISREIELVGPDLEKADRTADDALTKLAIDEAESYGGEQ